MRAPLALGLTVFALAGSPAGARADDVHCPPFLGAVTIDGNVLVAAPCRLEGTIVIGNVNLFAGGSLVAQGGARIGGSVQAENADFVELLDAEIVGNVQLDNLVGERSLIHRSSIGGSIQLVSNRSRLEVIENTVDADVQAFGNDGLVMIADNRIDGNLQCKENEPDPVGGNNVVHGNMEDQCENLLPEGAGSGPAPAPEPPPEPAASSSGGGGSLDLAALLCLALGLLSARAYGRRN